MANHILYYATLRGLNPKEHFPYTEILWAPKDKEGFTISFEFDQVKQFRSFFYKYGFVIVRDVVDRDQIEATIDELWKTDYLLGNCDRSDPLTWEDDHFWPTAGGAHKSKEYSTHSLLRPPDRRLFEWQSGCRSTSLE